MFHHGPGLAWLPQLPMGTITKFHHYWHTGSKVKIMHLYMCNKGYDTFQNSRSCYILVTYNQLPINNTIIPQWLTYIYDIVSYSRASEFPLLSARHQQVQVNSSSVSRKKARNSQDHRYTWSRVYDILQNTSLFQPFCPIKEQGCTPSSYRTPLEKEK